MFYRILFISSLLITRTALGQTRYTGSVGSAAIEMTLPDHPESTFDGVYMYTRINTPIALDGALEQGTCKLVERDTRRKATATLIIPNFTTAQPKLVGTWKNLATGQQLPLTLSRLENEASAQGTNATHELLQVASLPTIYCKTVLTGKPDDFSSMVTAVRLFDKKTSRLVQQVSVEGQSRGMHSVSVGDFNFDGHPDFSVFESSYAGPNTTSLYFLFNPTTKRYVESGFAGTSLQFDASTKRVYETNSCCAGSSVQNFTYKIVRNRMVLVEQHCLKWDEKKQALVERKLRDCQ